MKIKILFFLIFYSTTLGCNNGDKEQFDSSLIGEWILTSIQNVETTKLINYPENISKKESINFTDSISVFIFNGVCNRGQGRYSLNGNHIAIKDLFTTQMSCQYSLWESYLRDNLDNATNYRIDSNKLVIYSSGTYNLIFKK